MDNQTDNVSKNDVFGITPYTFESSAFISDTIFENKSFEMMPETVESENQLIGGHLFISNG